MVSLAEYMRSCPAHFRSSVLLLATACSDVRWVAAAFPPTSLRRRKNLSRSLDSPGQWGARQPGSALRRAIPDVRSACPSIRLRRSWEPSPRAPAHRLARMTTSMVDWTVALNTATRLVKPGPRSPEKVRRPSSRSYGAMPTGPRVTSARSRAWKPAAVRLRCWWSIGRGGSRPTLTASARSWSPSTPRRLTG